jgi:hypothetical protein
MVTQSTRCGSLAHIGLYMHRGPACMWPWSSKVKPSLCSIIPGNTYLSSCLLIAAWTLFALHSIETPVSACPYIIMVYLHRTGHICLSVVLVLVLETRNGPIAYWQCCYYPSAALAGNQQRIREIGTAHHMIAVWLLTSVGATGKFIVIPVMVRRRVLRGQEAKKPCLRPSSLINWEWRCSRLHSRHI